MSSTEAPHEIVTLSASDAASDGRVWVNVKVECSACDHVMFTGTWQPRAEARQSWIADHIAQHAPGRALDIEVDWEPSALCSVCEDGIGDIDLADDGLACRECGTTWDIDGENGETNDHGGEHKPRP